jgi:hypothetical protein
VTTQGEPAGSPRDVEISPSVGDTRPVSGDARVIRGPWLERARERAADEACTGDVACAADAEQASGAKPNLGGNKMMLGFIVRDCAVALGHAPSAEEFAAWANHQSDERGEFRLFGRAISVAQARVMLKHLARPVTVRPQRLRPRAGVTSL